MTKADLTKAVEKAKSEQKEVIETMYNSLSQTARKKMEKDDKVKKHLDRHKVERK